LSQFGAQKSTVTPTVFRLKLVEMSSRGAAKAKEKEAKEKSLEAVKAKPEKEKRASQV